MHRWRSENNVFVWDVVSYYSYLPAHFIYDDVTLVSPNANFTNYNNTFWPLNSPIGKPVFKTSMGMAVLYSPFFFIAHIHAKLFNYELGGYSLPYRFWISISGIFYLLIGLYFFNKFMTHWFDDKQRAFVIFFTFFGTNLLWYSTGDSAMSHVFSFALISAFAYYTVKWNQQVELGNSLALGILLGLITLVRPINGIIILFLILYKVNSFDELVLKFKHFIINIKWLVLISTIAFIIWIPQMMYWKEVTGQWLYFSYGSEERFFWNDPVIIKFLFSFRKGWFIYTPLMLLCVVFMFSKSIRKELRIPIFVILIVQIYVSSSWWCWWFGGGYSQRGMIDFYPLFAIGFIGLYEQIKRRKALVIFVCALLILNWKQTFQMKRGSLHYDGMTSTSYKQMFFLLEGNEAIEYKRPDYDRASKGLDRDSFY